MEHHPHASEKMKAVVRYLESNPELMGPRVISEGTGISYPVVKVYLRRCLHYGWISNPYRGMYCAAEDTAITDFTPETPSYRVGRR